MIQTFRNRLVLVTGLVIPIAISGYVVYHSERFSDLGSVGFIAAIVMFTVLTLGLHHRGDHPSRPADRLASRLFRWEPRR